MPVAQPSSPPKAPAPLPADEVAFITETVRRFFGDNAVVRNFGPDPSRMALHVETDRDIGMAEHDCIGVLMTRIDCDQIRLVVTRRGVRVQGEAKFAYRQGIVP